MTQPRGRQLHVKRRRKRLQELDAQLAAVSCALDAERRRLRLVLRWAWLVNLQMRKANA